MLYNSTIGFDLIIIDCRLLLVVLCEFRAFGRIFWPHISIFTNLNYCSFDFTKLASISEHMC